MEFVIKGKYKIDEKGVVYSSRGELKPKIEKNHIRICINQKWVSYARVIATYLIYNPNGYDKIIFIDGNPLNCVKENIKWVSDEEYNEYVYLKQIKNKTKIFNPDLDLFNREFLEVSKKIKHHYWRMVSGYAYIKTYEKYNRGTLDENIQYFVLSQFKNYFKNMNLQEIVYK